MKYGEQLAARTRPWDRDNQDDRYVFRGLQPIGELVPGRGRN